MNHFQQIKKNMHIKIQYWFFLGILFLSNAIYAQNKNGISFDEKNNNFYQMAEFYYNAGNACYYSNRLDSALNYYEQSMKQSEKEGTEDKDIKEKTNYLQIKLFKSIGVINDTYGRYDSALDNYFKALSLAEKIHKMDEVLIAYLDIAHVYSEISNLQQAEAYYLKGEKLSREINDSTNLAISYQGLCRVFIDKEDYAVALEYGEQSYRIMYALPNVPVSELMFANQELIEVWLYIPDYNKALEYALKTVEYARQTGTPSYLTNALYMLSTCYLKKEQYRESEKIALEALATDSTNIYVNSILYGNIAQANIWLKNHAKGIEYFRKTTNAIRAYSNKNFQSSLSEMEVKYETEKKELKISALEKEKQLMVELGIAGGAVLLLALAAFLFLWRWTVQKRRVSEQQKQLAEQQVKQLEQEKQLVATQSVLEGETHERSRLARDLHDGLGSMLTGVKLNLMEMKKGVKLEYPDVERFDNALGLLDDSVQEMRRVAHHLMPDSLSRFGLKPAVEDFCRSFEPTVVFDYFGDEARLDPMMEIVIYRSIHELVNNALKYSGASQILVQIMQEPNRIAFTVQDDGCGFDPSAETKGTGLQNIRNRIASFGGTIQIDSKAGEGTEVNVELRIKN